MILIGVQIAQAEHKPVVFVNNIQFEHEYPMLPFEVLSGHIEQVIRSPDTTQPVHGKLLFKLI